MKAFSVIVVALLLFSCAAGPVHIAKTESEGIKTTYDEAQLNTLHDKNKPMLQDIYTRFKSSNVNIYKEGIGFTALTDSDSSKIRHYYLMVKIRPQEIVFDESSSKPEQRLSKVMKEGFIEKYLSYIKKKDLELTGVEGVAFGVYWPVRDFSRCQKNGGFLEYIIVHLSKDNLNDIFEHRKTLAEVVSHVGAIASLDLKPPQTIKTVSK